MGLPTVFPTGVTIYDPEKCSNGYTLLPVKKVGTVLIDMNGNVVKTWKNIHGQPNKLLPGGYVMGSLGIRDTKASFQDQTDVVQIDWDGNVVWKYNKKELIEDEGHEPQWMARQHHDYQREGNPVGYPAPGMFCKTDSGNTLILCHETIFDENISKHRLQNDVFIEVDWEGNIVWEWHANEHYDELGLSEEAKMAIYDAPDFHPTTTGDVGDWFHCNSMSYLGPNKWYDQGDERFCPDNIIFSSRECNIVGIISKNTGEVVWKLGPEFTSSKELRKIGQIIGQHCPHIIPKGLPGEGNILLFDNGGGAGYGRPTGTAPDGNKVEKREYSRVLEINPVTLEVVWSFIGSDNSVGMMPSTQNAVFFSQLISNAQRLPNGNTLVTEGCFCRIFELTPEKEIVWEYRSPFDEIGIAQIYRAYRYPYDYVPQLEKPVEIPVERLDNMTFRVPGAAPGMLDNVTEVPEAFGFPEGFKTDDFFTEEED